MPRGEGEDVDSFDVVHYNVRCAGRLCVNNSMDIHGPRYACSLWHEVNLCSRCVRDPSDCHDNTHTLLECLEPAQIIFTSDLDHSSRGKFDAYLADNPDLLGHYPVEPPLLVGDEKRAAADTTSQQQDPHQSVVPPLIDVGPDGSIKITYPTFDKRPRVERREKMVYHPDSHKYVDQMLGLLEPYSYDNDDWHRETIAGKAATRVFDLLPGTGEENLVCDIKCIPLTADTTPDDAISYTWKETSFKRSLPWSVDWSDEGAQTAEAAYRAIMDLQHPLYVGDHHFVTVGAGLRDALFRMRSPKNVRTIWCDQVCIDQSNANEKSLHVRFMALIYGRARNVVLWLGDSDADTPVAAAMLEELYESDIDVDALATNNTLFPRFDLTKWKALLKLFTRPVFTRSWVIQEITFAQSLLVRCGEHISNWDNLARATEVILHPTILPNFVTLLAEIKREKPLLSEDWRGSRPEMVRGINDIRVGYQRQISFDHLLDMTCAFQATDLRDKVYAVLGMCGNMIWAELRPDYNRRPQDVYRDASMLMIARGKTLSPFARAGLSYQELGDLPSWAADWSCNPSMDPFSAPTVRPYYMAGGNSAVVASWPGNSNILRTQSHIVGKVSAVCSDAWISHQARSDSYTFGPMIIECAQLVAQISWSIPPSSTKLAEDFVRCWMNDAINDGRPPASKRHVAALALWLLNMALTGGVAQVRQSGLLKAMLELAKDDRPTHESKEMAEAIAACTSSFNCHRSYVTDNGHYGFGPVDTKPEDEVHIISGGRTPYVLRKDQDSELRALVGDAYVQGLMAGEALKNPTFAWKELLLR